MPDQTEIPEPTSWGIQGKSPPIKVDRSTMISGRDGDQGQSWNNSFFDGEFTNTNFTNIVDGCLSRIDSGLKKLSSAWQDGNTNMVNIQIELLRSELIKLDDPGAKGVIDTLESILVEQESNRSMIQERIEETIRQVRKRSGGRTI